MSISENELRRLRNEITDYEQTVDAIITFAALVVHDGNSRRKGSSFGVGRRMDTSSTNSIRPNKKVTPDLVAQRSSDYGIVAEVKKSLPRDTDH